jgi:hypothetical protein
MEGRPLARFRFSIGGSPDGKAPRSPVEAEEQDCLVPEAGKGDNIDAMDRPFLLRVGRRWRGVSDPARSPRSQCKQRLSQ